MRLFQKLLVIGGLAMAAAFPAMAQQGQQQAPMMGQGGMMGGDNKPSAQGGMMGQGQDGMMGGDNRASPQGGMMGGMMGGRMMGEGNGGMLGGCPMGDMGSKGGMMMGSVPMMEGRLAYIKADLEITPAQEQAWNAYADAVRARHTAMQSIHGDMAKAMQSGNALDRMDARIKALQAKVDSLKTLKPAMEALYAVLTDLQKKEADQLLGGGCDMR
jgi:Spy/CpxP family protein refolding chaperone